MAPRLHRASIKPPLTTRSLAHADGSSDEVLNSPRLLNLPLLLLANKQDAPSCLTVSEIRESFDAWHRARVFDESDPDARASGETNRDDGEWQKERRKAERMASLDVMGVSALEG